MKAINRIATVLDRGGASFTLIELLAVMAIVATLAGIVSTSVSGTGDTSAQLNKYSHDKTHYSKEKQADNSN